MSNRALTEHGKCLTCPSTLRMSEAHIGKIPIHVRQPDHTLDGGLVFNVCVFRLAVQKDAIKIAKEISIAGEGYCFVSESING